MPENPKLKTSQTSLALFLAFKLCENKWYGKFLQLQIPAEENLRQAFDVKIREAENTRNVVITAATLTVAFQADLQNKL